MRDSSLKLTQDQEEKLVSYCIARVDGLAREHRTRIKEDKRSWKQYENQRQDHEHGMGSSEYGDHITLPLCSKAVDHFACRAKKQIFGTPPFFHIEPVGQFDRDKSQQIDQFGRQKLDRKGHLAETLIDSLWAAYIQRAVVFKTIWERDETIWRDGNDRILYDKSTDKPVMVLSGGSAAPVTEMHAKWVPHPSDPNSPPSLEQDPSVKLDPDKHEYRKPANGVEKVLTRYVGAAVKMLDFDAFLAPLTDESIQKSDFLCELYDQQLPWVKERWIERPWEKFADYESGIRGDDARPKSETERTQESQKARDEITDDHTKQMALYECWLRWDVLQCGTPQDFMVIIDKEQRKAVYYEYTANICPDYERPYVAISICSVKGRWCADKSLVEKVRPYNRYIDKQFSRETKRNELNANPIGACDPTAVEDNPCTIDMGVKAGIHRLKPGKKKEDFLGFITMPQLDTQTHELILFVDGKATDWLGISPMSQGDTSQTPDNPTAMGIQAMFRESNMLGTHWIEVLGRGYEKILLKLLELQLDNMDESEAFSYNEGDASEIVNMTREELNDLELRIRITIAESDPAQKIGMAQTAIATVMQYAQLPPPQQAALRPIFVTILKNLGVQDTDRMLPQASGANITAMPQPGQPGQPAQAPQIPQPLNPAAPGGLAPAGAPLPPPAPGAGPQAGMSAMMAG